MYRGTPYTAEER